MTLAALQKRLAHFEQRVRVTTPGTAARSLARNKLRQTQRMMLCYQATGSIAAWTDYKLTEEDPCSKSS